MENKNIRVRSDRDNRKLRSWCDWPERKIFEDEIE